MFAPQRHLADYLLSGREFESTGADCLNNVRVVDAAYESMGMGGTTVVVRKG